MLAVDLTQNYSSQCKLSAMISSVIIGPGSASSNLVSCHRLVLFGNFIWGRSTEFTSRKKKDEETRFIDHLVREDSLEGLEYLELPPLPPPVDT